MQSISKNFIFNLLKTLMSIIFPLITFPYASRILGVDNLGKVQYCNSIISYFSLISTLGISIYAVREGSKYKDSPSKLNKFCKEILLINSISTAFAYTVFCIFMIFFFKYSYYMLMIVCSFTLFFNTYSIEWLYQIKEDYKYISIRAFVIQIISLLFLFIFVKTPSDYVKYAFIYIISSSGNFIFNFWNSRKYIKLFKKTDIEIKKHIRPIVTIFGVSLASSIYMNLDTVMLGAMKGTVAVGLYAAAVKISQVVKTLINAFSNVLFPRLSNYLGNNKVNEYKLLLYKGIRIMLMFTIPAGIGMCMLSEEIIVILSGNSYVQANIASKILAINIIFSIIDGFIYYQILLPFGKEKIASICTFIGSILNLSLNFILIPLFSYNGAALTTLVAEFVVFIGLFYYSNKLINLIIIIKNIFKYAFFSIPIIIWCIFVKLYFNDLLKLMFFAIIGSVIFYSLTLILFKDKLFIEMYNEYKVKIKIFISNLNKG